MKSTFSYVFWYGKSQVIRSENHLQIPAAELDL